MISGDVMSVVRSEAGWNMVTCTHTILGWHVGRGLFVEGDTLEELFDSLRVQRVKVKRLAIGFPRSDFLIRVGSDSRKSQFPDIHRLVFWQRSVDRDGVPMTETVAMRKDMVEYVVSLARDSGFDEILIYPSWFGVVSGWPRLPPGGTLTVDDGSIRRTKQGWSPWNRIKPVSPSSISSEYQMNLGGLLLLLSYEVPEDWLYPHRSRRSWRILGVLALIFVCMIAWYFSGVLKFTGDIGNEQVKRDRLLAESSLFPLGCTVDDVVEFFLDHSTVNDSTSHITRFRYSRQNGIEITGRTFSVGRARSFVDGFKPDHFSITQTDAGVVFSFSSRLPCDH